MWRLLWTDGHLVSYSFISKLFLFFAQATVESGHAMGGTGSAANPFEFDESVADDDDTSTDIHTSTATASRYAFAGGGAHATVADGMAGTATGTPSGTTMAVAGTQAHATTATAADATTTTTALDAATRAHLPVSDSESEFEAPDTDEDYGSDTAIEYAPNHQVMLSELPVDTSRSFACGRCSCHSSHGGGCDSSSLSSACRRCDPDAAGDGPPRPAS